MQTSWIPTNQKTKRPTKIEIKFDESYKKLAKFKKEEITKDRLEKFMKENPGLIIKVTAEEAQEGQRKLEKRLANDPIGKMMLEESKHVFAKFKEKERREMKKK